MLCMENLGSANKSATCGEVHGELGPTHASKLAACRLPM
jgi:hypothetical protein